jgi:predicted nucleotidyltransferase
MRLLSSEVALRIVTALAGAGGLTLSRLSRAVNAPTSSTNRALDILQDDGFVVRNGHVFDLAGAPAAGLLVQLAQELLAPEEIITIVADASGQVEFVGRDDMQLLAVFGRASDPLRESRIARLFDRQAARLGLERRLMSHDDVRRELEVDPERRSAYLQLRRLFGSGDDTFPDRRLHGATTGERLGRPHPLLRLPPARALHRLRKRHGIRSAKLFGSAVRTDFRTDSDVDVAIDLDRKPSLSDLIGIEEGLEQLFQRDVDLVLQSRAAPQIRAAIEREGVELLR